MEVHCLDTVETLLTVARAKHEWRHEKRFSHFEDNVDVGVGDAWLTLVASIYCVQLFDLPRSSSFVVVGRSSYPVFVEAENVVIV